MTDINLEKVVIGLSGGIDSYTCAYLLNMQKVELIAVTIANDVSPFELTPETLAEIKEFCHRISIPHLVVDGSAEFRELVLNTWVDKTISGKFQDPELLKHDLILDLLFKKKQELGASKLATGHFAKLSNSNNGVSVLIASEEKVDQSFLVSRLRPEILGSLVLPLSDLLNDEVIKIAENFGISIDPVNKNTLIFSEEYLKDVPQSILNKRLPLEEVSSSVLKLSVVNCVLGQGIDWTAPIKGFINTLDGYKECTAYPRNLHSFLVELEVAQSFRVGEIISFVRKNNKNSKIYFSGECRPLKGEESV